MTEEEKKRLVSVLVGSVASAGLAGGAIGHKIGQDKASEVKPSNCVNGGQIIDNSIHITNFDDRPIVDPD